MNLFAKLSIVLLAKFTVILSLTAQDDVCMWQLQYGMPKDSVEALIKIRENILPSKTLNLDHAKSVSIYFNAKIEGCTAKVVNLYFENNKLVSAEATFCPDENSIFKIFIYLLTTIVERHGSPNAMNLNYINTQAVGGARHSFVGGKVAIWLLPRNKKIDTINLMITDEKEIKLDYIENKNKDSLLK